MYLCPTKVGYQYSVAAIVAHLYLWSDHLCLNRSAQVKPKCPTFKNKGLSITFSCSGESIWNSTQSFTAFTCYISGWKNMYSKSTCVRHGIGSLSTSCRCLPMYNYYICIFNDYILRTTMQWYALAVLDLVDYTQLRSLVCDAALQGAAGSRWGKNLQHG